MNLKRLLTLSLTFAFLANIPRANAAVPTYAQVRAIFAQRCLSCHDAKEAEGDLVMETFEALMKGGKKGVDVVRHKADESRLVRSIERREKPFMPPPKKADALPAPEIALIRAWIDAGAPGPLPGEAIVSAAPTTRPAKIIPKTTPRRPVLSLAYEPKAKLVAAARPGEVEVWSADDQQIVHRFAPLEGDVNAVAFSADGTRLYAAGGDPGLRGRVWEWNTADGKLVRTFDGHADAIYALAISPDGATLATGSYDQKITLWDAAAKPLRDLIGHNGAVFGVAFRPDGKVLASASADRTMKLWDVATGRRLDTRPESQKDLYALAWSPDGTRVVAGGADNRLRVWSVSPSAVEGTNSLLFAHFAHEGAILRAAWSPDGNWILSSADDNTVRLFDARDVSQKATLPRQSDWPTALAFAGGGAAVVGRFDGSIAFYDVPGGAEKLPPKPTLTLASPRGVERGRVSRVKLTGKNISRITGVKLANVPEGKASAALAPAPQAGEAFVDVTTAADAPLGPIDLSVTGPGGDSAAVKLFVDDLPQVEESEPNDMPARATALPLPASAWGAFMPAGDADYFALDLKRGQNLVLDVAANRLGSKAQVQLALSDASGRILATATSAGDDADPLVAFTAPADGRYAVKLTDLAGGGTDDNFYRLSAGDFAYATGTFPLAVAAGAASKVKLVGLHLPADAEGAVQATTGAMAEATVAVDGARYRTRRPLKVLVSATPELVEVEPNDAPAQAMRLPVPASVSGRIDRPGDADLYRFAAKGGTTYVVETNAARRGSPVDTKIQVLDAAGRPVQRVQLRAVRDSTIAFRGFDSNAGGGRFPNYLEMDLDQYVYMNGDVARLFRYPDGPDAEYGFHALGGKRRAYFDTTATAHALDEKVYVVEPHPPGEKLAVNGLPVFPIYYENDDDSDRLRGSDSRLLFTAPADGDYLARVTDARGFGGDAYTYCLTVRPALPDFAVSFEGYDANVPAGTGRDFAVKLDRIDGFDGPVRVDLGPPPAGFLVSSPVVVEAGQWEARATLYAAPDAPPAATGIKASATAVVDGKSVTRALPDLAKPVVGAKGSVFVSLEPATAGSGGTTPAAITVTPGKLTPAWLRAKRNGYAGILSFDARNLPHGVYVADVGLNGVQILEGQTERQIFIGCAPWVADVDRPCHMRVKEINNPTTPPVTIRVRRAEATAGR